MKKLELKIWKDGNKFFANINDSVRNHEFTCRYALHNFVYPFRAMGYDIKGGEVFDGLFK